jgi:hypothetical protein
MNSRSSEAGSNIKDSNGEADKQGTGSRKNTDVGRKEGRKVGKRRGENRKAAKTTFCILIYLKF